MLDEITVTAKTHLVCDHTPPTCIGGVVNWSDKRSVDRIMVTAPSEGLNHPSLLQDKVASPPDLVAVPMNRIPSGIGPTRVSRTEVQEDVGLKSVLHINSESRRTCS